MRNDLERLGAELAAAMEGLDAGPMQLRPAADGHKWSIQQIVEHLLLSYDRTLEVLDERLAKGRPTRTKPKAAQRIGQFVVVTLGRFPKGRAAPPTVMPDAAPAPQSGAEMGCRTQESLTKMQRATLEAERLFGQGRCASHLVLGPMSTAQWRRFHLVHGRHHIKQIRRIRKDYSV